MIAIVWRQFLDLINTITLFDIIDVLLVAFVIYSTIRLVRETRAEQLLKGLAAVLIFYLVASQLEFRTLEFLMRTVLENAVLALLIVFQPEARRALEQMGRTKISSTLGMFSGSANDGAVGRLRLIRLVDAVCDGCAFLSKQKMGAIIVIERETKLGEIIKTGTMLDSDPSMELIGNIFFKNSPLHDGAMVVRAGRCYAAGCFLPLTSNENLDRSLGTRHRAAIGMSENSDAIVVVVSEETGIISVALEGKLTSNYNLEKLNELLRSHLLDKKADTAEKKNLLWRGKK